MGIRTRFYLLRDDGTLSRIARRVVDGLSFGTDAIPDLADTRQKVIQVLVESEGGKPAQILDVIGSYWDFDKEGKIDASLRSASAELLDFASMAPMRPPARGAHVVDLVPELKRKQLYAKHHWTVSQQDVDRIAADLWPGINGPAPAITSVKGKAPRKPSMSYEARKVLSEVGLSMSKIASDLDALTEASLRGIEFEAERHASYEDGILWRGVAEYAKKRRAILAARRTGRGGWYAVIEAFRHEDAHTSRQIAEAHAKAATQGEAVEAGRRLMAEKAHWLAPDVRVDVSIYSALEWQPSDE